MRQISEDVKAFQQRMAADLAKRRAEYGPLPAIPVRESCSGCKGAGWVKSRAFDPEVSTISEIEVCPKCSNAAPGPEVVQRRIAASGMDHKRAVTFSCLKPYNWQEGYWRIGLEYVVRPRGWLWLTGGFSTGKSSLAFCIGNEWLDNGKRVMFRTVPLMLEELRHGYDRDAETDYFTLMNELLNAPLLILDDYGKQADTEWALDRLFQISDHRLERSLPTVVTTNLSMKELDQRSPRLFSRVIDAGKVTVVNFPDMNPDNPF